MTITAGEIAMPQPEKDARAIAEYARAYFFSMQAMSRRSKIVHKLVMDSWHGERMPRLACGTGIDGELIDRMMMSVYDPISCQKCIREMAHWRDQETLEEYAERIARERMQEATTGVQTSLFSDA